MVTPRRIPFNGWLVILAIPPLILAGLVWWLSARVAREGVRAEARSDTLRALRRTLIGVLNAETGQRGYLITGESQYLDSYERAKQEIPERLRELRTQVSGGWIADTDVNRIEQLTNLKLEEIGKTLEVFRREGREAAYTVVSTEVGKNIMDDLRSELARMDESNSAAMQRTRTERDRTAAILAAVAILSALVTAGGLMGLYRVGRTQEREIADSEKLALEALNQHLGEFAHMAAHDLRSPARSTLGLVQLARRMDADSDGRNRLLEQAEASLQRQMDLIQSLLTYQRVDGKQLPPSTPVSTSTILGQVKDNLRDLLDKHNAVVKYSDLPEIQGYAEPLMLLFQNLIENSIKYSRPDVPPEVVISARRSDTEWLFSIRDNGLGFDKEYSERIFRPFERLHGVTYSGSGIGLATCAKVAKLHGGRIWAESKLGQGSEFFFTLPDGAGLAETTGRYPNQPAGDQPRRS